MAEPRFAGSFRFFLIVPALLALMLCSTHGAPTWRMLETPRFTVISQLGDKPTREWAEEFNQFIEELRLVFKAERPHMPPLTVMMFARDRDFSRYKPLRPDGRGPAAIDGFFNHNGNWSIIGLAENYTDESTRELIFHEGVHWFTSTDPISYPLWLSEGIAEVFSTFRQESGKVRWGTDITPHVAMLRSETMIPFERFLYLNRDDPLFNHRDHTGIFYAQSWVFVHYLLYGAHDGSRDAIARYFDVLASGTHPDEAFQTAFGHDYKGMETTLGKYIRTGKYGMSIRPESTSAKINARPVVAPAADVEVALARLALAASRNDVARPHAEKAVRIAPEKPGGHEMLAQVHQNAGDHEAALAACTRAVDLGSEDASTLFLLAYLTASESSDLDATTARTIATWYRRVIKACPTMEVAYQNLAAAAPVFEPIEDEDFTVLKQGARMFPQRGDIMLGLAILVDRGGDRAGARLLLEKARQRGLALIDEQRARRLETSWIFDETNAQIEKLAAVQDFTAALAVCDAAMAKITDIYAKGSLVRLRQSLVTRAKLHEADLALRAGDFNAARQLYETMLTGSGLPANLRRHIEGVLQRLPVAATSP